MKYCPQCGRPAQDDYLFCTDCGFKFPACTVSDQPSCASEQPASQPASQVVCDQKASAFEFQQDELPLAPKPMMSYWLIWVIAAASLTVLVALAFLL